MTSPPSPPNRRRRRVIVTIAVLVLVIVSLCTWWYWPRGDARFIGKWLLTTHDLNTDWWLDGGPNQFIEFHQNGSAVLAIEDRELRTFPFPWQAEAKRIRFGHRKQFTSSRLNNLHARVMRWIYGAADPYMDDADYELLRCGWDRISLLQSGTETVVELQRATTSQFEAIPPFSDRAGKPRRQGGTALFEKLKAIDAAEGQGRKRDVEN